MDHERISYLAKKIVDGSITEAELDEFNLWYGENSGDDYSVRSHTSSDELAFDMFSQIADRAGIVFNEKKTYRLWPHIGYAAVMALMVFTAGFLIYNFNISRQHAQLTGIIAPGKSGATLTLSNGRKIHLDGINSGEIANEAGINISKTAEGEIIYEIGKGSNDSDRMNTLSTAKGETYMLILPDKSQVWMNAASTITYSAGLIAKGERKVRLEGEAYFQIAKDKAHPFIVESRGQQVRVLGTHFNVNSYADEPSITTTLLEGSVKVENAALAKVLSPGQQSSVTSKGINISSVDVEKVIAWKNGAFLFEDETLGSIMRKVARWYDVRVVFKNVDPNELYGGGVSRYEDVAKVLENLELTGGLHFKIEGRTIIVMK